MTLAETVARSIEPRYRALSAARSANSSWVIFLAWRARRTFTAMTSFRSMSGMATWQERCFQERSFLFVLKPPGLRPVTYDDAGHALSERSGGFRMRPIAGFGFILLALPSALRAELAPCFTRGVGCPAFIGRQIDDVTSYTSLRGTA